MNTEQKPEKVTAADIKKQIDKAKEEMKGSSLPITGQLANEINASESTPKEPIKAEVKPDPVTPAAKGPETPSMSEEDIAAIEWGRKKGIPWTQDPTILKAMHKSDMLYHEYQQKEKEREQQYKPTYGYVPPVLAPAPVYAAPPVNNRQILENLGRQYNMPPEDVERLLNFNRDYFQMASQADRERYDRELQSIKQAEQKNSAFRELASDPTMKNPEVAAEFARLLPDFQNRDPRSFENDPNAYIRVRDQALINIARRNLIGQPLQEGIPLIARPPTNPPPPLGKGSGGGAEMNERGDIGEEFFKLKTPQEKKAYLEARGLVASY